MSFDIPRDRIFQIDSLDIRLDPGSHPFEDANREAIERNWQSEKAANPALYDGRIMMLSELAYRDGRLAGRCHEVRYATFLFWRLDRAVAARHAFAHAVLACGDGALVAIRMAPHTANAGRVYFAAGSFEPEDFPGGQVDFDGNMEREVREETGLELTTARRDPRCFAIAIPIGTAIFRRYTLPESADEVVARINDFIAGDPDAEISEAIVIRSPDDLPDGLMPQMPPMIAWHFANPD